MYYPNELKGENEIGTEYDGYGRSDLSHGWVSVCFYLCACNGERNGSCVFTISQDICVAVPVEFGATATVGDAFVNCNAASAEDICTDCGKTPEV